MERDRDQSPIQNHLWAWICPVLILASSIGIFFPGDQTNWGLLMVACLLVCIGLTIATAVQEKRRSNQ